MSIQAPEQSCFDRIARPYRWLEYLTLGYSLERCRTYLLPQVASSTHALVLGDGDGRALAHLLAVNSAVTVDVVDSSAAMLALLRSRCQHEASRLKVYHAEVISFVERNSPASPYDLIVTHFFLDCLTQPQVDTLAVTIAPQLTGNAIWLFSDFRIPSGVMRLPAQVLIRTLYLAFRILTGLRSTHLPDHASAFHRVGFTRISCHRSLFGMLTTELWGRAPEL